METTSLRVIHKSILHEALKKEDNEELEEVLTALAEKYKEPEESKIKMLGNWLKTKFSCGASKDSEAQLDEKKKDEFGIETMAKALQKLEDAHIQFAKEVGEEEEAAAEVKEMTEKIEDLQKNLRGEKRTAMPLWDAPNEQGNTCLHMSTSSGNAKATKMLLDIGANPNVQDAGGDTPLHNACRKKDIEQATDLLEHQAKLLTNIKTKTPEIEKLFENQEAEKVKALMASIVKSNDRVKIYQKLFIEKKILFDMIDQQELLEAVLERDEHDDDLADFVNYNNPGDKENTALHNAVNMECYPACSVLLKAGDYQFRSNRDAFTPAMEKLFNHDKASVITDSVVRGLLLKVRFNLLNPDEAYNSILSKQNEEGETLLSRLNISMATRSEIVRLPSKGLRFNVVNTELPEALQAWFKADGKVKEEEEAVKVRELLEKKGVVMRMRSANETEAVRMWNARNKNLREYIHHHVITPWCSVE